MQSFSHRRINKTGFTLVEILIALAMIALMAAILFPILHSASQKAQDVSCSSRLHQLGLAIEQYSADNDGLYPAQSRDFFDAHCFSQDWSSSLQITPLEVQNLPLLSSTLAPYANDAALFHDPSEQGFSDDDNGGACNATDEFVAAQAITFVQRTELSLPQPKMLSALSNPAEIDVLHTFSSWRKGWTIVLLADGHIKGMNRTDLVTISQRPLDFQ